MNAIRVPRGRLRAEGTVAKMGMSTVVRRSPQTQMEIGSTPVGDLKESVERRNGS